MAEIAREAAEDFIAKWQGVAASELSTSQSFLLDLCRLLGVDSPHPDAEQSYMFERPITFAHGDGSTSPGRIDLYRACAGSFDQQFRQAVISVLLTISPVCPSFATVSSVPRTAGRGVNEIRSD